MHWQICAALFLASTTDAASSFTPGLYGLNPAAQLFRLSPNGSHDILSNPLPYLQAQQLSAVDPQRGIFWFIGYSRAASGPFLVGLSLANGSTLSETALPEFYDGTYVGLGQYVTPDPSSERVFVGGQDVNGFHVMGLVAPGSGAFEVLANLTSSLRDVFGGTCVFVPETNELWFELDVDIFIFNMATKKTEVLPASQDFEILGMNRDPSSGVVYGLGGGPGQGVRTVVALHAANRTISPVGTVPAYAMQMGGITAFNYAQKRCGARWPVALRAARVRSSPPPPLPFSTPPQHLLDRSEDQRRPQQPVVPRTK